MFTRVDPKNRFASLVHFAPPSRGPSLTQVLIGVGLVVFGVGLGTRLAPIFRNWNSQRALKPRNSAPVREIDRWANEGGAVPPPSVPKTP